MPSRSRLGIAQATDEEFAERIIAMRGDDEESGAPPLEYYTPEVAELKNMLDRLGEMMQMLEFIATRKQPSKVKPSPRPVTAFDTVRKRMAWDAHTDLVDEVEEARRRRNRR